MAIMEAGRICIKTTGKDAGKKVVVLSVEKENKAVIEGISVKKKKCNIRHLIPTEEKTEATTKEGMIKALKR